MSQPQIIYKQYGGKASISKWIVSHFPEHKIYCEPFCGSCSVLFAKPRSFVEIVNDMDSRLINLFSKLRENPKELAALLWATPYSKENWRSHIELETLEDAALFMAESVQYYCGNGNTSTWAIDKTSAPHKPKPNVFADWFLRIAPAAARLKDVQILHEDACKTIERVYQMEDALIYLDPPYVGHEKEYRFRVDYQKMVDLLHQAKCKVIVSEYPEAESYFKGWTKIEKETPGRCSTGHTGKAKVKREILYLKPTENVQPVLVGSQGGT